MYRERELPLFVSYSTFESIIQKQIKQLEEPAIQKLKEVSGTFFFLIILESYFAGNLSFGTFFD